MALPETRLDMAVEMVAVAYQHRDVPLADRLAGFRTAHAALVELAPGDDERAEAVLEAAWSLVDEAYPKGASLEELVAGLRTAHAAVVEAARPPVAGQPTRRRRDA